LVKNILRVPSMQHSDKQALFLNLDHHQQQFFVLICYKHALTANKNVLII